MIPTKKYSIVIPAKNGMPYLEYAVRSALATDHTDMELLVSLELTGGDSKAFLDSITDERLRVIYPNPGLSMSEHWDFAQSHAVGEWQMFLGQDDLMMTGYIDAFQKLTEEAIRHNLGVIVARRAYVCWPPLREPGLRALQYWKTKELSIRDSKQFAAQALLTDISYHAGPQMYTTTLVSRSTIDIIRKANHGRLVMGHPQDAYLAAALLKNTKSYLFSGQPFSWVGTSSRSAGLAITKVGTDSEMAQLGNDYEASVRNSKTLSYSSKIDFRHGINARYFLDALENVWPNVLETPPFSTQWFQVRVDAGLLFQTKQSDQQQKARKFLMSTKHVILKYFFASWLSVVQLLRRVIAMVATKLQKTFAFRALSLISIEEASSCEALFCAAKEIKVTPVKVDS
jgi:hypothetical protein